MTLERWLARNEVSQAEFARRTGITQSAISKYISGDRQPMLDEALAIERATHGAVPVEEWETDTASGASR
jgi:DNA-binding transcriptional regulator YdaS (Cro superfamily)